MSFPVSGVGLSTAAKSDGEFGSASAHRPISTGGRTLRK
jgi:hypothetical protein